MAAVAGVTAVFAGASLVGTSIEQIAGAINTDRNITINITNYSKQLILTNPRTHCTGGYNYHPPQPTILKHTKEVCSFSKVAHTARGVDGVMTYQILRCDKGHVNELVIMFSVPYDFNVYENMFAFGIFEPGVLCDDDLFNKMYYEKGPFIQGKGKGCGVEFSQGSVLLKGTMSDATKSTLIIEIFDKCSPDQSV